MAAFLSSLWHHLVHSGAKFVRCRGNICCWSFRRHNAVVHGLRGPRCSDRGSLFEEVRENDGPHDLGGEGKGAAVDALLDEARRQGRDQGAHRMKNAFRQARSGRDSFIAGRSRKGWWMIFFF